MIFTYRPLLEPLLQFQPPLSQTKKPKTTSNAKKNRFSIRHLQSARLARFYSLLSWLAPGDGSALQQRLQSRRRTPIPACRLIRETFSAHLVAAPIICRPGCRSLRALNFLLMARAILSSSSRPPGFWDLQEFRSDWERQGAPTRLGLQGWPTNSPLRLRACPSFQGRRVTTGRSSARPTPALRSTTPSVA